MLQGKGHRKTLSDSPLLPGYRLPLQLKLNIKLRIINSIHKIDIDVPKPCPKQKHIRGFKNFASNLPYKLE